MHTASTPFHAARINQVAHSQIRSTMRRLFAFVMPAIYHAIVASRRVMRGASLLEVEP
jgi:hypothetical protein